jgi:hypothetical protein
MSIVSGLFFKTGLLGLAMAASTVTPQDCATVDYNQQVQRYGAQMAAAQQAHRQDLYAQSRDAKNAAQANATACAALAQSSSTNS